MSDTIFALSSGHPPAGIAVIRVSGPRAFEAAAAVVGKLPPPRQARLRTFRDPESFDELDRGMVLVLPAPGTATGENIVEFHCHGGRATIYAMLSALGRHPQLRMAEPGEFTRQALSNGRIDLTEAEGLADLLAAETELQRKVALRRADGAVRTELDSIRDQLLRIAAEVELAIDYVDEEDGEGARLPMAKIRALGAHISSLLERAPVERLRQGIRVIIAGPPNAGKSSLLNYLVGKNRAIVTDTAGTTRDSIEVPLDLGGLPVVFVDTAGLRESDEVVERLGIDRARRELESADIVLWLGPAGERPEGAVVVHAKADLGEARPGLEVSSLREEGRDTLLEAIKSEAADKLPAPDEVSLTDQERACLSFVGTQLAEIGPGTPLEVIAHGLRLARERLDRVSGRLGTEDMLDALFSRFCVGK